MFGNVRIKAAKSTPKKPQSNSNFAFVRAFDRYYRNPYTWGLVKCCAFFAASVYAARVMIQLEILPMESSSSQATQSAY